MKPIPNTSYAKRHRKVCGRMRPFALTAAFMAGIILLSACGSVKLESRAYEIHRIMPPNTLETVGDNTGADSFDNLLDNSGSSYYVINDYFNMKSGGTLHILPNFETYQQTTEYTCGCACALMALHYLGNDDYNELQIAEKSGTREDSGTSVEGLNGFLESVGVSTEYHADTDPVFDTGEAIERFFVEQIDAGRPVLVDWEDFGGHWQVVIGIDTCNSLSVYDDVLIVADPYDVTDQYQDGYGTYPFGRFIAMWREGACIKGRTPYEQPYIVIVK